jgi:type III pantothenate kinase
MLLVVDVGNTNTVLGLYEGSALVHHFRIESSKGKTVDEYHVLLRQLIELRDVPRAAVTGAILASVVPSLSEVMTHAMRSAFGLEPLIVGPGIKTGMPILYENPREVGADRIVNAVAAFELVKNEPVPPSLIVVDFGTATTFDCISSKGEYLGGAIAPGVQIAADALFSRAARLPRTELTVPPRVIGRTTVSSMQSGILYGYVGLVDGLVERIRVELGGPVRVFATGGLAPVIRPLSKTIEFVDEHLTLEGLRILFERNRA